MEPIQKHRIQIRVQVDNRNAVVPCIQHEKVPAVSFDWKTPPTKFRKMLVRIFRLKGLVWQLEKRSTAAGEGFEWAEISKLQKSLNQGDETRIRIIRTNQRRRNSPGTTRRVRMDRANSRSARKRREEEVVGPPARKCIAILCQDRRVTKAHE
jgi:hypothetical protein